METFPVISEATGSGEDTSNSCEPAVFKLPCLFSRQLKPLQRKWTMSHLPRRILLGKGCSALQLDYPFMIKQSPSLLTYASCKACFLNFLYILGKKIQFDSGGTSGDNTQFEMQKGPLLPEKVTWILPFQILNVHIVKLQSSRIKDISKLFSCFWLNFFFLTKNWARRFFGIAIWAVGTDLWTLSKNRELKFSCA